MLNSLKTAAEAAAVPPTYLPSELSFENYQTLNRYGAGLWRYLFNSVAVALITVVGTLFLSLLGGFGFARYSFPGKRFFLRHHSGDPDDPVSIHPYAAFYYPGEARAAKHSSRLGTQYTSCFSFPSGSF